jgi:uncharacterized protein (TIGR03435 family)
MRGFLLLLLAVPALPQQAPPAFEVASVKPTAPDDLHNTFYGFDRGSLQVTGGTLKGLVQMAYEVPDFEIYGGPGWMEADRFNIIGKYAPDPDQKKRMKDGRLRLQTLLAERFHLQIHRETKEIPEYVLSIGKTGSKLTPAPEPAKPGPTGIRGGCGQMTGTYTTMANLAFMLTRQLRRPVVDRTGLDGKYDFQIDYTPDAGGCGGPAGEPTAGAASDERPSIFTAIQETLGLKLEASKGPVEVVVIDRAAKPDAN